MKIIRTFLITLVLLLVAGLSLYFFLPVKPWTLLNFKKQEVQTKTYSILEEIRSFQEMTTAVYYIKTVFPYDFVSPEEQKHLQQLYLTQKPVLTERDVWLLGLQDISRMAGMDLRRPTGRFLVFRSLIQTGMDFTDWNPDENFLADPEHPDSLTVHLPEVTILKIRHDDLVHSEDSPDFPLNPQIYAELLTYLEPQILQKADQEGLLEEAGNQGRKWFADFFSSAGFSLTLLDDQP